MGKKIPGVSYLFGRLTRKKKTSSQGDILQSPNGGDETSDSSSNGGSAQTPSRTSYSGGESSCCRTSIDDPPPPPGHHHARTASCHHQRSRSTSAVSKLAWSLSTGFRGGAAAAQSASKKKLKHEDSIWKKTIILGERCRVPDEDDETILYDENGDRICTYHPKSNAGNMLFSRQNSSMDQDSNPPLEEISQVNR